MKRKIIIAVAILIPLLILFRFVSDTGEKRPDEHRVYRIIDGDTFELEGGDKVRLLGIDSPEKGELFYDSATAFLSSMLVDKKIRVVFGQRKRDHYGRLLAYVYIDTALINAAMLRSGLASVYLFRDSDDRQDIIAELITAQRQAIGADRGIWSLPVIEEDYYIGNTRSMRFHRPDCRSVEKMSEANRIIFHSRREAFELGYSACRNCKP